MELVHIMLQTLIEMCVANIDNQEVIYNSLIMDVLNGILQLRLYKDKKRDVRYAIEHVSDIPYCRSMIIPTYVV